MTADMVATIYFVIGGVFAFGGLAIMLSDDSASPGDDAMAPFMMLISFVAWPVVVIGMAIIAYVETKDARADAEHDNRGTKEADQ